MSRAKPMKAILKPSLVALTAAGLLALGGCLGGGGDDDAEPTAQVPASASNTADDFIAYVKALVAASADTLEPVDIAAVTPPGSETAEPTAID